MKKEEIYDAWKTQKQSIEIHSDFVDTVMRRIKLYRQEIPKSLRWFEYISTHPLLKAGVVMAGMMLGFMRVFLMIHMILFS